MIRLLSLLFGLGPFAFAAARAATTGTDFRYVWVALAASAGAVAVVSFGTAPRRPAVVAAASFAAATAGAVIAAILLGTRFGPGLLIVASGFGFCFGVSIGLNTLSRQRSRAGRH